MLAIVRAYQTDFCGSRLPLAYVPSVANADSFEHHAWPEDGPAIDGETLEELEDLGLVRIGECGAASSVRPTRDAVTWVARYERACALSAKLV